MFDDINELIPVIDRFITDPVGPDADGEATYSAYTPEQQVNLARYDVGGGRNNWASNDDRFVATTDDAHEAARALGRDLREHDHASACSNSERLRAFSLTWLRR